jgi:hypothetical protein
MTPPHALDDPMPIGGRVADSHAPSEPENA